MGERSAVLRFVASGLLSVLVIGLLAFWAFRAIARDQALDRAKDVTRLIDTTVVEPALTQALVDGDPAALRRFDRLIRRGVLQHSNVVRVKLWTPEGRIVYSDEPRLIGRRYSLDGEEREVFETDKVEAEVSELSEPENRFERGRGQLLEVYVPAHLPSGKPLLFESYRPTSTISGNTRDLTRAFLPALIGGLLLLWLVNLPMARALARRAARDRREREAYLQAAMSASERERRRIAADLHDGIVQDMNGLSLSLAAESREAETRGERATSGRLAGFAAVSRQLTRGLRNVLVDIYPPSLHREGLKPAFADLAEHVGRRGIDVELDVADDLDLAPDKEALLFRVGQEAVRNVVSHAHAGHLELAVRRDNGTVRMTVHDDGRGFVTETSGNGDAGGHLGLRAMRSLTEDAGGRFHMQSAPGAGTTVEVEVSAR